MFNSVDSTEDTPNLVLNAKTLDIVVNLSADSIDERQQWVDILRKAIPIARKKVKVRESAWFGGCGAHRSDF